MTDLSVFSQLKPKTRMATDFELSIIMALRSGIGLVLGQSLRSGLIQLWN